MNTVLAMLATEGSSSSGWQGIIMIIGYVIVFGAFIYFLMVRPQKKQQAQLNAVISSIEPGDSVLTTSGFYGVVIDINDDVVIVEFGNNKNCRIPMQKTAIVDVEKAKDGLEK